MDKKKLILTILIFCISAFLVFADDSGSGIDSYVNGFVKSAQTIAILVSAGFCVILGIKMMANGGFTHENVKYMIGIVGGIIIIVLALKLPTWVQTLGNG